MAESEQQTEVERQNAENEKKRRELAQAYKRLFMTDDGKVVYKDLESFCGQNRSSVCSSSPNPYQTFEAEGRRRVFLRIDRLTNRIEENE